MIVSMAARTPRRQTFADLVKEATWSETAASRSGRYAPRPGGVSPAGEFFDPEGLVLSVIEEDVSVEEAKRRVDAGALIVAESCGCGGGPGGCAPRWRARRTARPARRSRVSTFNDRYGTHTWIDLWGNDERTVVYAHGDVSWGSVL